MRTLPIKSLTPVVSAVRVVDPLTANATVVLVGKYIPVLAVVVLPYGDVVVDPSGVFMPVFPLIVTGMVISYRARDELNGFSAKAI